MGIGSQRSGADPAAESIQSVMFRPRILTFVARYLPGYKSGGPIRTLANMVEHLSDEFEFWIVTDDRDAGDEAPYQGVPIGQWTPVGEAKVLYLSRSSRGLGYVHNLIRDTPHEVLYLNSCFAAHPTIFPLLIRRFGGVPRSTTVLAPRGELSEGAMKISPLKKRSYLVLAKLAGLYDGLVWQASSEFEASEIRSQMGAIANHVVVAPNLLPRSRVALAPDMNRQLAREPGPLRILFLSRISPKKNLDFLLKTLRQVKQPVQLTIVGPIDDEGYWLRCRSMIADLPNHVRVSCHGAVPHESVADTFARHDAFVFPTLNENFGHVIVESLSAGTPVIISDQTPWQPDGRQGLTTLPLIMARWRAAIEEWSSATDKDLCARREAAATLAKSILTDTAPLEKNRMLFRRAFRIRPEAPETV